MAQRFVPGARRSATVAVLLRALATAPKHADLRFLVFMARRGELPRASMASP
jgi:hypothetical protein